MTELVAAWEQPLHIAAVANVAVDLRVLTAVARLPRFQAVCYASLVERRVVISDIQTEVDSEYDKQNTDLITSQ